MVSHVRDESLDLPKLLRILPSYPELPDIVPPPETARLLGVKVGTLASARCGHGGIQLGYVRTGRKIGYPKTEIARHLLANAVGMEGGN